MNEDVNGNKKSFWREVSNAKGGKVKVESCSRIKDGNGRMKCEGFRSSIFKICMI